MMMSEEPQEIARKSETASRKFGLIIKKPQINADERRLVDFDFQQPTDVYLRNKVINSPQRTQRAQSTGIFKIFFEKTLTIRRRTRITRIGRIFTDPRASAQSVFLCTPSAFIRVHLRLAESNITPQQRAQSIATIIFASFALFAVRFINSLNELSSSAQPSSFIEVHPRSTYRTAPAEGR